MFKCTNTTTRFDDLVSALFDGIEQGVNESQIHDTIREFDSGFVIEIELPGVKKTDTSISVESNTLVVSATKNKSTDGIVSSDTRKYGTIAKKYKLNTPVSNTNIAAKMEDGILTITIPKLESAKARTINID